MTQTENAEHDAPGFQMIQHLGGCHYIPRSHPDGVSVNTRCLDPGTVKEVNVAPFDGQNWERYYPKGRAEEYPD